MEHTQGDFVESQRRKRKRRRVRNAVALAVALVLLAAGGFLLYQYLNAEEESVSVLTYRVGAVAEGEIKSVISGSGTLSAGRSESFTAPAAGTVEAVYFRSGDTVAAGELLLTLRSDAVQEELDALYDELETLRAELATVAQYRSSLSVASPAKGVVKDIRAAVGDLAEETAYLCRISTDGKMKLTIPAPESMRRYDAVTVTVENAACEGVVWEISDGAATILINTNRYSIGTPAAVRDASGADLGSGTLDIHEYVEVTLRAGRIARVAAKENQIVAKGTTLFTLAKGAPTDAYLDAKAEEADLLEQIAELADSVAIRAGFDALITTLPVAAGDEVDAGASLCVLTAPDSMTLTLSIDELDIGSVRHGQSATVTLDALEGSYAGTVGNISYAGSGSYVTSYTATVAVEPIPGAYPGMSASVEIVTDTSGPSMIVPAAALQYDGKQAFLYRADAELGQSVPENALELDALEQVNVQTGMADGDYVVVTADALAVGDRIWIPNLTTTAVYTDSEDALRSFTMGNGNMPSGGSMPSGGYGGNMPSGGFGGDTGRGQRPGS